MHERSPHTRRRGVGHPAPPPPPTLHKAMVRALGWYAAQRETDHILEEQRCP